MLTKQDFIDCQRRIGPHIHNTPVLHSRLMNELLGADVYFKCDNFQRMGAFKIRGATNAVLQLSQEQQNRGIVTHSSGNFAQAVALAGKSLGIKSYIVMPSNAPAVKKSAVIDYGGQVIDCEPTIQARETTAQQVMDETGATFLHPYDQREVIEGQGTAAVEFLHEHPDLQCLLCPIGGGGLISGCALAAKHFATNCEVFGSEPQEVDDAFRSVKAGQIVTNQTTDTIADGLKTNLGELTFPVIRDQVKEIHCVTESQIAQSMKLTWERMKIVIEPSAAVPIAAVLANPKTFKGKKIGIVISGGNVDLANLPF